MGQNRFPKLPRNPKLDGWLRIGGRKRFVRVCRRSIILEPSNSLSPTALLGDTQFILQANILGIRLPRISAFVNRLLPPGKAGMFFSKSVRKMRCLVGNHGHRGELILILENAYCRKASAQSG